MENDEITLLRDEIAALKAQLSELTDSFESYRDESSKVIKDIIHRSCEHYEEFCDSKEYLWPVVYRVFPDLAKTRNQIDAILNPCGSGDADDENR